MQPGLILAAAAAIIYSGRDNQLNVRIPRIEADVTVDGALTEPGWPQAAVLTGFSEFSPHDGIPAADSTQVLVWYSPTAIYFGIRAFEAHGGVHATLADRDKITADDNVQILLGTFHDHRQAYVFAVNPLGVQMDGTIVEQGQVLTGAWTPTLSGRVAPDLSQDFVFTSKGRLTEYGYEVEVKIYSITDYVDPVTGGALRAKRKILLSLDIDPEKLPGDNKVWRTIKRELAFFRIPGPTLQLTPTRKFFPTYY